MIVGDSTGGQRRKSSTRRRCGIGLERDGNGGRPSRAGTYVQGKETSTRIGGTRERERIPGQARVQVVVLNVRGFQPGGAWIGVKSKQKDRERREETIIVTSSPKQQSFETLPCV